jgi:amidase
MDDYSEYDGLGLADLVAKKQVTPSELVEAAIARIEKHNPALNAVVYKGYDDARKWAAGDLPDGPFKGVPFLIRSRTWAPRSKAGRAPRAATSPRSPLTTRTANW